MALSRPNPDQLLVQVQSEEAQAKRGQLKIFFGYAAGVGKTYAMLQAARQAVRQGREVVVGYLEPHARPETQALAEGLEVLPAREVEYKGVLLCEFNLDAALARHPEVLLVDELAHVNAEGCRHEKRWQDVEELRAAGIHVWTTLNVQHIESLNDVIGQITGILVRETIPDQVFDSADELELIDVTPEELLTRLSAGKIYVPAQAQRAVQSFFQKSNLTALRELSLRQTARRIHTDVESARLERLSIRPWATVDRLMVCVGPSPTTARVIRTAKRMAAALDAPWLAVCVELPGSPSGGRGSEHIAQHFRLAERLGAETVTLSGSKVTDTLLEYARSRNVTKILIGKTNQPRWRRLMFGTVIDEMLEQSGEIDIYVIQGEEEKRESHTNARSLHRTSKLPFLYATAGIAVAGCLAGLLQFLKVADTEANTVMIFLAAVAWVAFRYGRQPAIAASGMAVLLFDYFFVPPLYTFAAADAQYVVTFSVMLVIGLIISTLASRLRAQVESTGQRERRTLALYELGKQLSSLYGQVFLCHAAAERLSEIFEGEVAIYLRDAAGSVELVSDSETFIAGHSVSLAVAQWVIDHGQTAGAGTDTLPNAAALFIPLMRSHCTLGTIAVRTAEMGRLLEPNSRRLLDACANQLTLALERDQMAVDAAEARIQAESEQVRSSLLSSVSHDLKTPLAVIAGASSSLLRDSKFDETTRSQLLETISEEASRLNRLLENLLQMSRFEAGAANPSRQWHVLEELIGSALHRTQGELKQHKITIQLPSNLPLIFADGLLLEQVFVNLLENVARHTPAETQVAIHTAVDGTDLRIALSDDGPGFPAGMKERIFEKFFRASTIADDGRGSGLGLAICRAILKAHGGQITAHRRPGGGAEFVIRFPLSKEAPQVVID